MTFDEYQKQALRTAGGNRRSLAYSMGGIGGEAGEYVDVVKKYLFHGKDYAESRAKALLELGDLVWGAAQAADAWGFTLNEVATVNLDKLRKRYPDGFSVEAAAGRADERPPGPCEWSLSDGSFCGWDRSRHHHAIAPNCYCEYHLGCFDRGEFGAGPVPTAGVEKVVFDPRAP